MVMPRVVCMQQSLGATAVKFFNSLLSRNSGLLESIVHADIALSLSAAYRKCWTAEFIEARRATCTSVTQALFMLTTSVLTM